MYSLGHFYAETEIPKGFTNFKSATEFLNAECGDSKGNQIKSDSSFRSIQIKH